MPSVYSLNPPPNPFWDFVAGIEDHPFFSAYGRPPTYAFRQNANQQPQQDQPRQADDAHPEPEPSEKAKGKQPTVEDPPEVDPSTINPQQVPEEVRDMPFRGRGRFGHAFEAGAEGPRRGPGGCRGRGGHPNGPPPFMFGPFGAWGRHGPGPHPGPHPEHEGPGHHRRGCGPHRGGHGHPHRGPGPHSPPRDGPPHHHGRRGPGGRGFDLSQFLNNLGERLGVDLAGAAEGLGADRFTGPRQNTEADFEPRTDIFDTPTNYTIHLSLPGAKKEDVGVDYDGEHSILRIAGVVHRPGVDEHMLEQLAVNGRKRENGVFEKSIRLGTKREPASIDVAGISAKMTDGVLIVKVPKVEVEHKNREVPISGNSPDRDAGLTNEKRTLFDADEEMHDAYTAPEPEPAPAPVQSNDTANDTEAEYQSEKQAEAHDDRSETAGHEEQLPQYEIEEAHEESDWEKDGLEDEGEYVKINVD